MTKLDILKVLEEAKEFLQYIDDILNKYDDDDAEILSDDLEEIDSWFRESARKLIAGIVHKLREKRLINDDGTAPEETTKSE